MNQKKKRKSWKNNMSDVFEKFKKFTGAKGKYLSILIRGVLNKKPAKREAIIEEFSKKEEKK